ncbi:MAG: hypothetical protein DRO76_02845 [Candidatus Altiarchaeales archaeon]|mgnify:CR=1 FL=1|nr:MAG: hypothetical protein DRO76_02845 [Candidatus Altiarchaeales archaeon]
MKKKIILPAVVTILLLAVLLSQIDIRDILLVISSISPIYVLLGFILYSISYLLRTLRFDILLDGKVGIKDLFSIVCIHNMSNNLFPARTGEFSYVYLLKKVEKIQTSEGIATLMLARIFDFISIFLLFFISTFMVKDLPLIVSNAILGVTLLLALVVLFLISSLYYGDKLVKIVKDFCSKLGLMKFHLMEFLLEKMGETVNGFNSIRSKNTILYSLIFSIFIWSSLYSMNYVLLKGMNMNIDLWIVILGSTFSIFTTILPIQSIGGFGTMEGAWAISFISLGIPKEMAIASGFGVHIVLFLYFLIWGFFGILRIRRKS